MRSIKWGQSAFGVSVAALVMSLAGTGYALNQADGWHTGRQSVARTP